MRDIIDAMTRDKTKRFPMQVQILVKAAGKAPAKIIAHGFEHIKPAEYCQRISVSSEVMRVADQRRAGRHRIGAIDIFQGHAQFIKIRHRPMIMSLFLFSKGSRLCSGAILSAKTSPAGAYGAVMLFAILLISEP